LKPLPNSIILFFEASPRNDTLSPYLCQIRPNLLPDRKEVMALKLACRANGTVKELGTGKKKLL
jgi:hypothetical protein